MIRCSMAVRTSRGGALKRRLLNSEAGWSLGSQAQKSVGCKADFQASVGQKMGLKYDACEPQRLTNESYVVE